MENEHICPAEKLLKMLAGKWKPQIFRLALQGAVRFNALLRQMEGANKQSVALALKELEEEGILERVVVKQKPLHVEYLLSEKGKTFAGVFQSLEKLA